MVLKQNKDFEKDFLNIKILPMKWLIKFVTILYKS